MTGDDMEGLKGFIVEHVDYKFEIFNAKFDAYVKRTELWQKEAQPSIDLGKNVNGFGRVLAYILGVIAGIYGIFRLFKP